MDADTSAVPGRWWVFWLMACIGILNTMTLLAPAPLTAEMAASFGLTLGQTTGISMGLINFCIAVSALFGGALLDRYGIRRIWLSALIGSGIASGLTWISGSNSHVYMVLRIIQGCCAGPIMVSPTLVVAHWFPARMRGTVIGWQTATVPLAIGVTFAVVPLLRASLGDWHRVLALLGPLDIITALIALASARLLVAPRAASGASERTSTLNALQPVLVDRIAWAAAGCCFCLGWVLQSFNDLTPVYLSLSPATGLGLAPKTAGWLMALSQLAFVAGSALSGWFGARIFRGRVALILMASFAVMALALLNLRGNLFHAPHWAVAATLMLMGFALSHVNPQVFAVVTTRFAGNIVGKVGGFVMGASVFGGTFGVMTSASALHFTGHYALPYTIVLGVAVAGFLISTLLTANQSTQVDLAVRTIPGG